MVLRLIFALSESDKNAQTKAQKHVMARTVRISNSRLNRYGFRLLTSGAMLEQFKRNPILLFMHNRPWRGTKDEVLPIGLVENIRIEGDDVLGDLVFDQNDDFAKQIEQKWDAGIYRMVSGGVTPIEYSEAPEDLVPGQTRATVKRWNLDEVSVVDIGANDDALALKDARTGKYITLSDNADMSFIPEVKPKSQKMENIALKLGLPSNATEEQIIAEIARREGEATELKLKLENESNAAITLAVTNAVKDKRILETQKEHFIGLGKKVGIEALNTTLAAIEPVVKPTELLRRSGGGAKVEKKFKELTSAETLALRTDNPEEYARLFYEEYGYKPNLA